MKKQLIIVFVYLIIVIIMTWPVVSVFNSEIAGMGGDSWQTLWRFEEKWTGIAQATSNGELISYMKYEFGGGGEARLVNLSTWVWMPIYLLFGVPGAYNFIWLASYVLAGWFTYLLVRDLVSSESDQESNWLSEGGPFLAGLVFALLPYHTAHALGHFGAMQVQWLPLIMWLVYRWRKEYRWPYLIGLGVALTVQVWSEHHYGLWLLITSMIAVIVFYRSVIEAVKKKKVIIQIVLLMAWLMVSVILPYWPTIKLGVEEGTSLSLGQEQTIRYSADLLAFVTPPVSHPVWGGYFENLLADKFTGNEYEATQYLSVVLLLLVLFFWQRIPVSQRKFWFGVGVVFAVISLGPRLHVMGKVFAWPMPYALVDQWPVLNSVRAIARAGVMVGLAVAVLIGWVLRTQVKRRINYIVIGTIVLLEFAIWPVATQSAAMPRVYEWLRGQGETRVVEVPAATNYVIASRSLWASQQHGKEVIGNIALERAIDPDYYKEARSIPALRQLLYLRSDHLLQDREEFMGQELGETMLDVSRWLDFRNILVHQDSLDEKQKQAVEHFLGETMRLEKQVMEDVWVYEVGAGVSDGVFVGRDEKWILFKDKLDQQDVFQVNGEAKMWLYNADQKEKVLEISWFEKQNEGFEVKTDLEINDKYNEIRGRRIVQVILPPGKHDMVLASPVINSESVGKKLGYRVISW